MKSWKNAPKKSISYLSQRLLGDITKFIKVEVEQSLKIINEEINSFSNFEEQISLENGDLNNISYDDSSFPDVIDADSFGGRIGSR